MMRYTASAFVLMISFTIISNANADEPIQHLSHTLTPIQCGNQDLADPVHIESFVPVAASSAIPFIHCNGLIAVAQHPSAVEIVDPTAWEARGDDIEGKLYLCSGTLDSCKINYEP